MSYLTELERRAIDFSNRECELRGRVSHCTCKVKNDKQCFWHFCYNCYWEGIFKDPKFYEISKRGFKWRPIET